MFDLIIPVLLLNVDIKVRFHQMDGPLRISLLNGLNDVGMQRYHLIDTNPVLL